MMTAGDATLGRSAHVSLPDTLDAADLWMDLLRREVRRDGRGVTLTPKEFDVLAQLMVADGQWVSSGHLLETIWGNRAAPYSSVVRITVARLRAKLGEPGLIETKRGTGYRITPG